MDRQPTFLGWDGTPPRHRSSTSSSQTISSPSISPSISMSTGSRRFLDTIACNCEDAQGIVFCSRNTSHIAELPVSPSKINALYCSFPTTANSVECSSSLNWERKYLLQLCQDTTRHTLDYWSEILQLILQCPGIVQPISLHTPCIHQANIPAQLAVCDQKNKHQKHKVEVYKQTILGAMCSMDMSTSGLSSSLNAHNNEKSLLIYEVIRRVLELCPWQVRCSQIHVGHTPLRDAVRNPTCLPSVLALLIKVDEDLCDTTGDSRSVLSILDQDGMSPVNHLINHIQLGPSTQQMLDRLEKLLENSKRRDFSQEWAQSSSLLQLLSLGTSFGILSGTSPSTIFVPFLFTPSKSNTQRNISMHRDEVVSCIRLLLRWNPSLIHQTSTISGCSPIHVVLRNYGNDILLVREIIDRAGSYKMLQHRNHYGDLPLHVACSVGVPMNVLRLVLAKTLMVVPTIAMQHPTEVLKPNPHTLVWSRNNSGYTPVDLEWIRHIEAGHGFFSHRSFYPLDPRGVRRPGGRYDDLYDVLLRQAVDQVVGQSLHTRNSTEAVSSTSMSPLIHERSCRQGHASMRLNSASTESLYTKDQDNTTGLLLQRICLLIQASFCDSLLVNVYDSSGYILHQASALAGPHGPTLPRAVLELIVFQHPEQRESRDDKGKLPLHYAVQLSRAEEDASIKSGQEWKLWVQKLLHHSPQSCSVRDQEGRLPLHWALEYPSMASVHTRLNVQEARNAIIKDLAVHYPPSIEAVDPLSRLYPFQLAGANPLISLDTIFCLLRQYPGVIPREWLQ